MKVEIRPAPERKWHEKEGKDSFRQGASFEVLYDTVKGEYATGLTEEDEKKYAAILKVDLSKHFDPSQPHPYWSTQQARIKLPNYTLILDTDNPRDYIKWKNCRASKLVANSLKEFNNGDFPDATHIIYDEAEEVSIKAGKVQKRASCYAAIAKLTDAEKANLIQILATKTVRGKSTDYISVEMDAIIEEKPDELMKYVKMDKTEVYNRSAILEAIHRNILTKEGQRIYYMGEVLADDYEGAVTYFTDPQNQKLKVAILEKLN